MTDRVAELRHVLARLESGMDRSRKGSLFERLMQRFFETEDFYAERFTNVWLWNDRSQPLQDDPHHAGPDYGVDLVAKEKDGGGLCAIQCKFYGRNTTLGWGDLTKFLSVTKYEGSPFETSILVYTGKNLSEKQMDLIEKHNCHFIGYSALAKSKVDWLRLDRGKASKKEPYSELPHQKQARNDVVQGLSNADRGKLIMACGTGKTFVTLKIAEQMVGEGGNVLYLVPSISLMAQSMREWASQRSIGHRYIGVCSDTRTGRNDEDASLSELPMPVTTDATKIKTKLAEKTSNAMTVVFSTYQSLAAVSEAQKRWRGVFDLVICDEAHRTTGAGVEGNALMAKRGRGRRTIVDTIPKDTTSYFHAVHDNKHIRAKKRLYTTATPRVYNRRVRTAVKTRSEKYAKDFEVYSMDDESKYGKDLHCLKFSDAITQRLLSDYKVVVLTVTEGEAAKAIEAAHGRAPNLSELNIDNTAKMIGCWRALRDPEAYSLVVGSDATRSKRFRRHPLQRAIAFSSTIRDSQRFKDEFPGVVRAAIESSGDKSRCSVWHVDGRHNALDRQNRLVWLEESGDSPDECRVLSNARCLTEGVDVPALDAVLFLTSKRSTIDVIQAVGRVMRKSDDKASKYGYIVIPIVIKSDADVQSTLDDDEVYAPVWEVLRALRAHDDRIDQYLISGSIPNVLIRPSPTQIIQPWHRGEGRPTSSISAQIQEEHVEDMQKLLALIRTKIADKVGDRRYLEAWAEDVANIVRRIKERMHVALGKRKVRIEFDKFHTGLRKIINDEITEDEAIDMIAQHMVMSRVFDALFKDVKFTKDNPVSRSIDSIVSALKKSGMGIETDELEGFYRDVEGRVSSINNHKGRQSVLYDLYDKFFQNAFKRTAERLGIVYTPVEIADFILKSADEVLYANFERRLSGKNVHIIDPFAGTGTFIARLISDELALIKQHNITYKYKNEIHANEIILLAYYVAAVNCESTLSQRLGKFLSFDGLVLTDTFHPKNIDAQWNEGLFTTTQKHIERQRRSPIMVIIGNPPWSMGDTVYTGESRPTYKDLDNDIKNTYVKVAKDQGVTQVRSLYDSYIKAIRWASNRLGDEGVIAFVTNAGFLRSNSGAGVRACLAKEFNEIWCLDLRGHALTKGDQRKREGGNVFGVGSKAAVVINILVKNPKKSGCIIHYKDIGDYLDRGEKLKFISHAGSIGGIQNWLQINPDSHYDWLNQRPDTNFALYMEIGNHDNPKSSIFQEFSRAVGTSRDRWAYNTSKNILEKNMRTHINYCNSQDPLNYTEDLTRGKWDHDLPKKLARHKVSFNKSNIRIALYRPFFKQYLYFDSTYNQVQSKIPKFIPTQNADNIMIIVPSKFKGDFYVIATNITPDFEVAHHGQCFPLYFYDNNKRVDNITDSALAEYRTHYGDQSITKLQIFFYIYGILHHPEYRKKFANNLMQDLPRIPMAPNFTGFCNAGQKLVSLHLGFDSCKRYDLGSPKSRPSSFSKLSFRTYKNKKGKSVKDTSVILADGIVLFDNLPKITYNVNGRTPLEWVVDKYKITKDSGSGIRNDPCHGIDIIAVIEQAVYIGIESTTIVNSLPKEFEPDSTWRPVGRNLSEFMNNGQPFQSKL